MTTTTDTSHLCVIYIKATRETVWEALTSPEFTERYFHHTKIKSTWRKGDLVTYYNQDGSAAVTGNVLEIDPPDKLQFTWNVHYNPEAEHEGASRVTFTLETVEDATRLTLLHDGFHHGSVILPAVAVGWIAILSNLKTLIETDDVMAVS